MHILERVCIKARSIPDHENTAQKQVYTLPVVVLLPVNQWEEMGEKNVSGDT